MFQHAIANMQKLSHGSTDNDHRGFAAFGQPIAEGPDSRVAAKGRNRREVVELTRFGGRFFTFEPKGYVYAQNPSTLPERVSREIVALAQNGRSPKELAEEFEAREAPSVENSKTVARSVACNAVLSALLNVKRWRALFRGSGRTCPLGSPHRVLAFRRSRVGASA